MVTQTHSVFAINRKYLGTNYFTIDAPVPHQTHAYLILEFLDVSFQISNLQFLPKHVPLSDFVTVRSSPQTKEGSGWFSPGWTSPSHWAGGRGSGRSSPKPLLSPKLGSNASHGKWGQTNRWRRVGKKLGVM